MAKKRANGEGTIRKRGENCWEARYCYEGKRHSLFAPTQKDARKMLTEVISSIDTGDYMEETDLTVAQWMQTWSRDFLGNIKVSTSVGYIAMIILNELIYA